MTSNVQNALNSGTFCNLQISIWTASKKVPTNSVQLGETDETLFRVNKDLVERSALKPIRQASQSAGEILHHRALPFNIRGVYYIPNSLITDVVRSIRDSERVFWEQVNSFCSNYSHYLEQARARLNGHFVEAEYPPADKIRQKFAWNLQMMAFTAPDSLIAVSPEMYQEANRRFHQEIEEFTENSVALLRHKFSEMVGHVVERLTPDENGNRKIFRDTLIGNLREFLDDFHSLNLTNDAGLAEQVNRARTLIEGISPEDLRISTGLSAMISQSMGKVQEAVTGMIENAPKRRIRYQAPNQEDAA
ncbi:MAG: hypothetical protein HQL31_01280 [Planctomycetes bacterium]|nr:hypothetical protein [Planctomycetota bacterium]